MKSVAAGAFHTVAVSSNGRGLWAWGQGDYGQLGTGQYSHASLPSPVLGLASAGADARGLPLQQPQSPSQPPSLSQHSQAHSQTQAQTQAQWGGFAVDISELAAAASDDNHSSAADGSNAVLAVARADDCVIQVVCGDRHTVCLTKSGTGMFFDKIDDTRGVNCSHLCITT